MKQKRGGGGGWRENRRGEGARWRWHGRWERRRFNALVEGIVSSGNLGSHSLIYAQTHSLPSGFVEERRSASLCVYAHSPAVYSSPLSPEFGVHVRVSSLSHLIPEKLFILMHVKKKKKICFSFCKTFGDVSMKLLSWVWFALCAFKAFLTLDIQFLIELNKWEKWSSRVYVPTFKSLSV